MSVTPVKLFFTLPPQGEFDSYEIEVRELSSPQDKGTVIGTFRINPDLDYIEINRATSEYSWFKLTILDRKGKKLESKSAILGEKTSVKINQIRESIKDTSKTAPAFSDDELMNKMRLAAMRLNNIHNLSSIPDKFWPIIELLVRIDVCNVLAFDYAKYLKLEIPGGPSLSREELYEHYINVADSLQKYYGHIKKDSGREIDKAGDGDGANISAIQVSNATRLSYETGCIEEDLTPVSWFNYLSPLQIRNINKELKLNRNLTV